MHTYTHVDQLSIKKFLYKYKLKPILVVFPESLSPPFNDLNIFQDFLEKKKISLDHHSPTTPLWTFTVNISADFKLKVIHSSQVLPIKDFNCDSAMQTRRIAMVRSGRSYHRPSGMGSEITPVHRPLFGWYKVSTHTLTNLDSDSSYQNGTIIHICHHTWLTCQSLNSDFPEIVD